MADVQDSRLLARLQQRVRVRQHRQGSPAERPALRVRGGSQHHQDRAGVEHLQVRPRRFFARLLSAFLLKLRSKGQAFQNRISQRLMIRQCCCVDMPRLEFLPPSE